nr:hypothetical protein BN993_06312 [Virgibacillus halodenitrificans]
MRYLGWKAKVATSCRNAFMTNIVLARGSSAAPEKRSIFRSGINIAASKFLFESLIVTPEFLYYV